MFEVALFLPAPATPQLTCRHIQGLSPVAAACGANRHSRSSGRHRGAKKKKRQLSEDRRHSRSHMLTDALPLSHNSGLNCSTITSFSVLRLKHRGAGIPVTAPLCHTCNMAAARVCSTSSKSSAANLNSFRGNMTLCGVKSARVNGFPIGNKSVPVRWPGRYKCLC